jgi:hypothetical protein
MRSLPLAGTSEWKEAEDEPANGCLLLAPGPIQMTCDPLALKTILALLQLPSLPAVKRPRCSCGSDMVIKGWGR